MFSFIGINWRCKPLVSHETAVNLISRTTTAKGLSVTCKLDKRRYNPGRKIKDEEMASLSILRSSFRGDLNYTPIPRL